VNQKLWKIATLENEGNPVHRRLMIRFGVDNGMKIHAGIFWSVTIGLIGSTAFMISPQHLLDVFVQLMTPILAIISPIAVFVLVNDYRALRTLEKTDQISFIVKR